MSAVTKKHPYHLVDLSPWPILTSFALLFVTGGAVMFMHEYKGGSAAFVLGIVALLFCMFSWWRDVIKEGREDKAHTSKVRQGLRIGMALFIISELAFFFAFFFAYFMSSILPADVLDGGVWPVKEGVWPPAGVITFDPWEIPLMNTLVLLLSGTTVTWAHHALLENNKKEMVEALGYTIFLGFSFSCLQAFEYSHAQFAFDSGIYASNFYMATGFHGAHVIIGTLFLTVCYFRARNDHFKAGQGHLAFEFAAWYWHFVDVVWIFLFIFVYVVGR